MLDPNRARSPIASLRRRALSLPTLLSFALGVTVIVFLATTFDLDWQETWRVIRDMNVWLYLLAALAYYLSFAFRGARWRIMALSAAAQRSDRADVPSSTAAARLIVIGWFVNSVTWLRLGDAYRAYAFAEDARASFSWSLGTVLAERVLDMATVAVALSASVLLLTATSELGVSRYILLAALIMTAVISVPLIAMKLYGVRLARLLPARLEAVYSRFHQGAVGSFDRLPLSVALGSIGWLLEIARMYLVVAALGIEAGPLLIPVVALGHALLSAAPTPGGVGLVEPGITGLLLLQLSQSDAAAVAISDRSITYLSVIVVGGLMFLAREIGRAKSGAGEKSARTRADAAD